MICEQFVFIKTFLEDAFGGPFDNIEYHHKDPSCDLDCQNIYIKHKGLAPQSNHVACKSDGSKLTFSVMDEGVWDPRIVVNIADPASKEQLRTILRALLKF